MSSKYPLTQTAVKPTGVETLQPELALMRPGVISYIWNLGYGDILIEVYQDGHVAVNGEQVQMRSVSKI